MTSGAALQRRSGRRWRPRRCLYRWQVPLPCAGVSAERRHHVVRRHAAAGVATTRTMQRLAEMRAAHGFMQDALSEAILVSQAHVMQTLRTMRAGGCLRVPATYEAMDWPARAIPVPVPRLADDAAQLIVDMARVRD